MPPTPTADMHVGRLDLEVVPGQPRASLSLSFIDDADEPADLPDGTWTCVGGPGYEVEIPVTEDGETLVIALDGETTEAIRSSTWRLRLDGVDMLGGDVRNAAPSTTPGAQTVSVRIAPEVPVVLRAVVNPVGPQGNPGDPGPGLPTGGTEGQAPLRTAGASPESEWGDVATPEDVEAVADDLAAHESATTGAHGLLSLLADKADLVGGVVPTAQIPAIAISDVDVVADEAAMLALTAERGDVAVREDVGAAFMLAAEPASTLGNWVLISAPGSVTSVNGQTGVVVLSYDDVGADPEGAADAVASDLSDHESDTGAHGGIVHPTTTANRVYGTDGTGAQVALAFSALAGTTSGTLAAGDDARFTTMAPRSATTSGSLQAADAGKVVEVDGTVTLTIDPSATTAFATGAIVEVWRVDEVVTIVPGTGVTLLAPGQATSAASGVTITEVHGSATLRYRGSNVWTIDGRVEIV